MRTTQYFKTTNEEAPCDLCAAIISGRAPVDEDIVVEHIGHFARQWWSWLVCAGFMLLKESTILINSELVLQVEEHKTAYLLFVQPANKRKVLSPMMFTLMSLSSLPWAFRTITCRTRSIKVLEEEQKCKRRQLLSTKQG